MLTVIGKEEKEVEMENRDKQPFIKITDKSFAEELQNKGFLYLKETINKIDFYVFPYDIRIENLLRRKKIEFFNNDNLVIFDNKKTLRF